MAQHMLLLSYEDELHKCQLNDEPADITVGNDISDTVTFHALTDRFIIHWDGEMASIEEQNVHPNEQATILADNKPLTIYCLDCSNGRAFDVSTKRSITFGGNEYDHVQINGANSDVLLYRESLGGKFHLEVLSGQVFYNYMLFKGKVTLELGDELFIDGVIVKIGSDQLEIAAGMDQVSTTLTALAVCDAAFDGDYPDYHRSPRIIHREPEEKVTIAKPSSKPSKPSEQLGRMIVPPLVMIAAMVAVSFFRASGIYIIVMLAMTVTTIIYSIISYVKNVKKYRADTRERDVEYRKYLKQKTKELHEAREKQRHALEYHYPDIGKLREMAVKVDSRIYEKTMFHHDFLMYRVGLGREASSFEIQFNDEEFSLDKDELVKLARELRNQYTEIDQVPIVTSLAEGPVGYIGQRALVLEQLQLLVCQLAIFHSYHDVQFITIFPEEEKAEWEWMRWLPHASLKEINVRGFVYHERSRDQVLNSFYQILKERKLELEENANKQEKLYFSPHIVVLITDEKLILDHIVMEFFNEDPRELGVSLVFVQDVMQSLPEHVETIVDIRDAANGTIVLEKGELVNRKFTLDHFPEGFNKEDISRALAPLNHLQNLKNSIPESVTFLEMYGVEKVEELNVLSRWARNDTYKSLAVPLGLRGKDDIVKLNLHEKAHGPHGLIAGTTGSGKSEIIQSYILSLAVNFHPHEVAFLLIDYKGGGMANLFKNLPHLLGTITNLDGAQSMRALASIKAELQRRQRIFSECDVNHINQYQKLYKQGEATDPMPHLFLISDEFAELKAEQPDFMKELVSTARIGRSLGIHLILATQKPSGVVDDQIWSNSKFKIALKVQDASDSNEILKTPDAAEITLPGRAYLQVGNNEIYELFQSAWSGADYISDQEDEEIVDTTIYAINELGQYEILSEDLSGLSKKEEIQKVPTELDAVVEYIHQIAKEQQIAPLPRPWLPPLKERISLQEIKPESAKISWQKDEIKPLEATIGFADYPELQDQKPLKVNLSKDGHLVAFSSPGYGKSTFLQTVVMDLARAHNPEQLHVYLLDFGTNGLLPLKDLPHVADTFLVDDQEKIGKLLRRLADEIKMRKKKLSDFGAANLEMYTKASGERVPHQVIVIDNYDSIREADDVDAFESLMTQIAREGGSIGLHLVISAGRQNALRMPLLSNIKTQIALYLIDQAEMRAIIGKTEIEPEEIPGRGLIKLEQPTLFQTALPVEGDDSLAVVSNVQKEAKKMRESWDGSVPRPIPMVPETLYFHEFKEWKSTSSIYEKKAISLGVDTIDVMPVPLYLERESPFVITGDDYAKTVDSIEIVIDSLIQLGTDVIVIDNEQYTFSDYQNENCAYGEGSEFFLRIFDRLKEWHAKRKDAVGELRRENASREEIQALYQKMNRVAIVITDYAIFRNKLDPDLEEQLIALLEQSKEYYIYFIFGSSLSLLEGYDPLTKFLRETGSALLFSELKNQSVYHVSNRMAFEKNLEPGEAYYISNSKQVKMKTAVKGRPSYAGV